MRAAAILVLAALAVPAHAQSSVEAFYKNKKIRMLVGYGVGTSGAGAQSSTLTISGHLVDVP